jgi:hypothetical protein
MKTALPPAAGGVPRHGLVPALANRFLRMGLGLNPPVRDVWRRGRIVPPGTALRGPRAPLAVRPAAPSGHRAGLGADGAETDVFAGTSPPTSTRMPLLTRAPRVSR